MTMTDGTLLARRLARLRATIPTGIGDRQPAETRPIAASPRGSTRAQRLADSLGATVENGPAGPVVVLEQRIALPLAREQLGCLPYPVEATGPLLCLDTETTGLGTAAGTLPFLVGIGRWSGEIFSVRQLFLADQSDEPAFLAALAREIPADAWLVTYNGRSFDWPLLVTRYRLQRQAPPPLAGHLDLLPVARQLWRHRLEDARLASVERGVVGVLRHGDLSGALIPERYFAYLRTGRGSLLRDVADHNRQDVASLGRLLVELADRLAVPERRREAHPGDVGGLGRAFARRRRYAEALDCYETALGTAGEGWRPDRVLAERLTADRARLLPRLGRRSEAAAAWLSIGEAGGRLAAVAWLQVAKHREHWAGDLAGALQAADLAAAIAARARLVGWPLELIERDLIRRRTRLQRRLAAAVSRAPGPRAPSPGLAVTMRLPAA